MEFGISSKNIEILNSVFKKFPQVKRVIIYGSRAKGNFRKNSDVDLVITNSEIDRHDIGKILSEIDDSNFPYLVDLQVLNTIKNRELLDHINRVGKIFI
jgi:predicted nucleotidyltransferase